MKILFITSNRVGDVVLTTGLLAWLVEHHPTAYFTIACGPYGADLLQVVPRLDQIIIMNKKKWKLHWFKLWQQCANTKWDLIVDLRNSLISRLLRAKKRAVHTCSNGQHKVIEMAAVLKLTPPPQPHIWIAPEAINKAQTLLPKEKPILAIGPAANWAPKQWPIDYFINLVRELISPGGAMEDATVMVIADKNEYYYAEALLKSIPKPQRVAVIGYDLQTAAACLKYAHLFVGNDSGLMHLSAAVGTPTLGLFGPGFPLIYGPWGENCAYISTPKDEESPGDANETNLMKNLSVEQVLLASINLLARTAHLTNLTPDLKNN